jgi:8-oxo-dGTP pyrophosphatase MutT (NUDIX family)
VPGPQVVPRPDGWQPGAPTPWAHLDPGKRQGITLERIRSVVHAGPALGTHPAEYHATAGRPAAVLVALFDEAGDAHVLLTRRAATMRSHRHQVAFPGGRLDPGEGPEDAARREAHEEVGVDPTTVEILGPLPSLATFSGLSAITPLVAALPARPPLHPNPAEVERAFTVPLSELLAEGCHWEERWPFPDGRLRPVHFFDLPEDLVWGATARILVAFLCQILGLPDHEHWG